MANKVKDFTFRHLFHQIVFIDLKSGGKADALDKLDGSFKRSSNANGVICYGYIDFENGFIFEVLAAAYAENGSISIGSGGEIISYKIRLNYVDDCDIYILDKSKMDFSKFEYKINLIDKGFRSGSNAIDVLRCMTELDNSRSREYPDDLIVYIVNKNEWSELPCPVWVRCTGYDVETKKIIGKLLTLPKDIFNLKLNDEIYFSPVKHNDKIICISVRET